MSQREIFLSIIVCTYNRSKQMRECVVELAKQAQAFSDVELVIVDNRSQDDTKEAATELQKLYPNIVRYFYEEIPGVCRARNRGAEEAAGEILAFIDDDAVPHNGWVEIIRQHFLNEKSDSLTGAIAAKPVGGKPEWFPNSLMWLLAETNYGEQVRPLIFPEGLPAGHFAIKKRVYENIGGFKENLRIYTEEGEFFYRLSREGYTAIYNPALRIDHCPMTNRMTKESLLKQGYEKGKGFANTFLLYNEGLGDRITNIFKYIYLTLRVLVSWCLAPRFDKKFTFWFNCGWVTGLIKGKQ
jgi:glucosyl-dolichyl phosphate glucuronosyltransferase